MINLIIETIIIASIAVAAVALFSSLLLLLLLVVVLSSLFFLALCKRAIDNDISYIRSAFRIGLELRLF